MDKGSQVLSDITVYNKYAKYTPQLHRRETWKEICDRYVGMMIKKYCDKDDFNLFSESVNNHDYLTNFDGYVNELTKEILTNAQMLYGKEILMSMRAAQFAGIAIEKNHARIYNCSYLPIDDYRAFSEIAFLLLGGTGVGFSVRSEVVDKLPAITKPPKEQKFLVGDSIEGWADSIKALVGSYFGKRQTKPRFDYSDIRQKGELLVTAGGKAPGPAPLRICHAKMESILSAKPEGSKLTPLECHDLICHIADAVLAGGIRRAALISLFSADDREMLTCKHGNWWELNPHRGRANNSATLLRGSVTEEQFFDIWQMVEDSNSGEPGVFWTADEDYGTNPCGEISLRNFQFCNLNEINAGVTKDYEHFTHQAKAATFFGTLQAGFADFHYLRPCWKESTEKDALIGVGITGIGSGNIGTILENRPNALLQAADVVRDENLRVSKLIGIKPAARLTTIKPSGNSSCALGTSSGIHAWHSKYYIRNMQTGVGSDLYNYFVVNHPDLIKVMDYDPNTAVIGIPIKAPDNAILRENETALELLKRVKLFNIDWVQAGHNRGPNFNNVSVTVSIKPNEWDAVGEWMWENKDTYSGISVLPYDGGTYRDAPYMPCTEEEYLAKLELIHDIDIEKITEATDNTDLSGEIACSGGACEII